MAKQKTRDLTRGDITGGIFAVALPILLSHLFQNLYGSADSMIVGRFAGKEALAAVASTDQISRILIGFFTGLATGGSVLFSRCFGAKDEKRMHDAVHTALAFALLLGVILAAAGIALSPLLLRWIDCPADVYNDALLYIRIYLIGTLFTALYNVASAVLRSVGDSGSPLFYLTAASLVNIVLDLILVAIFQLGVGGAAAATVVSQLLAMGLVWRNLLRTTGMYRLIPGDLRINRGHLSELLRLGMPNSAQLCLVAMSKLLIQHWINQFGSAAMAGIGAANKLDSFLNMIGQSLGMALLIFIAQNTGAEDHCRARKGPLRAFGLGVVCMTSLNIPIYIFARPLIRLFITDPDSVRYGADMVRTLVPFYSVLLIYNIMIFTIRGYGKSQVSMVIGVLSLAVCRQIYLSIAMHHWHSVKNIYYCYAAGWFSGVLLCLGYFLIVRNRRSSERLDVFRQKDSP